MPRLLALVSLCFFLGACAFEPPTPPIAAAAPIGAVATELPTSVPVGQPTIQPSVTPVPPTSEPSPTALPSPTAEPTAVPLPRYDLLLSGATLFDATGAAPLANAEIAILDGRIAAIGQAGQIAHSADTPVRDLAGATILPGFINAHVHVSRLSTDELRGWARGGVTTVRDLSGPLEHLLPLRESIQASGDPGMPRLLISGPILTAPGGYPLSIHDEHLRVAGLSVFGPDDARAKVNALADSGVNLIKIAVSGRTDVNWPQLSDAEISAITETAHARGLLVSAHVDRASGLRRAVLNGINDAAHSPRDYVPDDIFALMVEHGVALIPSIVVYEDLADSRGRAAEWRRMTMPIVYDNVRRFVAAGGTLAFGDDFGGVPGMPVGMPMEEINHWIAAGLSPQQVIEAATRGSASVSGVLDQLGTVEVGKIADLLVVQGDPLSDIGALDRPVLVLHNGAEVPLQ